MTQMTQMTRHKSSIGFIGFNRENTKETGCTYPTMDSRYFPLVDCCHCLLLLDGSGTAVFVDLLTF
jgi:hypothetical protein